MNNHNKVSVPGWQSSLLTKMPAIFKVIAWTSALFAFLFFFLYAPILILIDVPFQNPVFIQLVAFVGFLLNLQLFTASNNKDFAKRRDTVVISAVNKSVAPLLLLYHLLIGNLTLYALPVIIGDFLMAMPLWLYLFWSSREVA